MTQIEQKLVRALEGDPDQCQCISKITGKRCPFLAVEGKKNCPRHGGSTTTDERRQTSQYRLQVWQQRLEEFAENEQVKCLRSEIGILRIMMESIMNQCHDTKDLIMFSPKLTDLATRIEKLVSSCHRIEHSMGSLMDKSTALAFAGQVVEIISTHIDDPDVIDAISHSIIDALSKIQGDS